MKAENKKPLLSTCCDIQRIRTFLESDRYHLEDSELIGHLDQCETCRKKIEAEAAEAELWGLTTKLLCPSEFDLASDSAYSAATCCGSRDGQPAAATDVLKSLVPSEDPQHLGRLGTYEVTGVIGVGGMGVVLKAIDPSLDRVVAVKVMNPRLANNEQSRKRFAREAKAAAAVLHPNVIPIHSVSSDSRLPYLVMACIRGGSLQKRIQCEGPLPLIEVLRIGSQIAAGLAAAHDQGLIHRDIKPENILLEEGVERVTITDFGLARAVDDNTVTQHGGIAGTPQYMSPEQARGEQLDQQSDLFSLGCVLYAMSAGRPPFRDDTSYGVMRKIIDETPTSIREVNPMMPDWVMIIVNKLMAKDKAERYKSAHEVHKLLDACLSHVQQPLSSPLPSHLAVTKSIHAKRNLIMKTIVGLIAAGSLFGIFLNSSYLQQLSQNNQRIVAQQEQEVVAPLSQLDSLIFAMMKSPHDMAFLNLGGIGKDDSYLSFEKIDGGIQLRLPAYDNTFRRRQGPYVENLRAAAKSFAIDIDEKSEVLPDGKVKGINFLMEITGDPANVAATIRDLVSQTFQVEDTEECSFVVNNMPSKFSVRKDESPQAVSAGEFFAEARNGRRVYLGEKKNLMYLIPSLPQVNGQLQWNNEIWETDVRELSPEQRDQIRKGVTQDPETEKAKWVTPQDYQPSENTRLVIDEIIAKAKAVDTPDWVTSPEDKNSFVRAETKKQLANRICERLRQISGVCPSDAFQYLNELQGLYLALNPLLNATESSYQVYDQIALDTWPLVLRGSRLTHNEDAMELYKALVALTRPHAAIRANDRLAEAGKPIEPMGEDLQVVHALALARTGDLDGAMRENKLFAKKLEVNQEKSRLPDLTLNFLNAERSPKSLLQQAVLQEALILALNGKKAEAIQKSEVAGKFDTTEFSAADQQATQELLAAFVKMMGDHPEGITDETKVGQTDQERIQGEWRVVAAKDNGRAAPPEALLGIRVLFTPDTMTKTMAGQKIISKYRLGISTDPKSIDVFTEEQTSLGIYELNGDTLRVCVSEGNGKRPTTFESQPISNNEVFLTLERVVTEGLGEGKK